MLPERIRNAVQASLGTERSSTIGMFNDYLTIARILSVLAQWSRKPLGDGSLKVGPDEARFDNILAPTNSDALVTGLAEYIVTQLTPSVDYVAPIVAQLLKMTTLSLRATLDPMNENTEPLALSFIDTTLKRLAGYMTFRGIAFTKPRRSQ